MPTFKITVPSTRSGSGVEVMRWTVPKSVPEVTYKMLDKKLRDLIALPTSGYIVTWTDEGVTHNISNTEELQQAIKYYDEKKYADRCVRIKAEPQDEIDFQTALELLAADDEEEEETPAPATTTTTTAPATRPPSENQHSNRRRANLKIHHNPPVDIPPESDFNPLLRFNSNEVFGATEPLASFPMSPEITNDPNSHEHKRHAPQHPPPARPPRGTAVDNHRPFEPFKPEATRPYFRRRTPSPPQLYPASRRSPSPPSGTPTSKFRITIVHSDRSDLEVPVSRSFDESKNASKKYTVTPQTFQRNTPSPPVQDIQGRKTITPPPIPARVTGRPNQLTGLNQYPTITPQHSPTVQRQIQSSTPSSNPMTSSSPSSSSPLVITTQPRLNQDPFRVSTPSPTSESEPAESMGEPARPLKVSDVCRKIVMMGYDVPEQKLRRVVKECKGNINQVLDRLNNFE